MLFEILCLTTDSSIVPVAARNSLKATYSVICSHLSSVVRVWGTWRTVSVSRHRQRHMCIPCGFGRRKCTSECHNVKLFRLQHPQRKITLSPAQKAVCCPKCGHVEAGEQGAEVPTSRRHAVVASVAAIVGSAATVGGEAEAAADAYEIPVNQQCIECVGSGVISCT